MRYINWLNPKKQPCEWALSLSVIYEETKISRCYVHTFWRNRDILNETRGNEDRWGQDIGTFLDGMESNWKDDLYLLHKIGRIKGKGGERELKKKTLILLWVGTQTLVNLHRALPIAYRSPPRKAIGLSLYKK